MKNSYFIVTLLMSALALGYPSGAAHAQKSATVIQVLDATGTEGIGGVILLVNPGDTHRAQAFITNVKGEATTHDLGCEICTVTAFDPRGLFASRIVEFSSASSSFHFMMQLRPIIDTVGDPQAVPIEVEMSNSKGEPLVDQSVVVRRVEMTLEENKVYMLKTDRTGHLKASLRVGNYAVIALIGQTPVSMEFVIVRSKDECTHSATACVTVSTQSPRHIKLTLPQLSSGSNGVFHESGHADSSMP
jgi:hypothetical protein